MEAALRGAQGKTIGDYRIDVARATRRSDAARSEVRSLLGCMICYIRWKSP